MVLLVVGILGAAWGYDVGGFSAVQGLVVLLGGSALAVLGLSGLLITSSQRRLTRGAEGQG